MVFAPNSYYPLSYYLPSLSTQLVDEAEVRGWSCEGKARLVVVWSIYEPGRPNDLLPQAPSQCRRSTVQFRGFEVTVFE